MRWRYATMPPPVWKEGGDIPLPACLRLASNTKHKEKNYFRFVSASANQPTQEAVKAAKTATNLDEILNLSKSIEEYKYIENADLCNLFRKASAAALEVVDLPNGSRKNRVKIVTERGTFYLRVFGAGKGVVSEPKTYTKEEIKKLSFGFCTSGAEQVTEQKFNPTTGEVKNIPVMYCKIA